MSTSWRAATILACALLAGCAATTEPEEVPEARLEGPRLRYDVVFEGIEDSALAAYLLAASTAAQETDRPPSSELTLRRRAEEDLPRLTQALRSKGYYDATIGYEIRRGDEAGDEPDRGGSSLGRVALELERGVEALVERAPNSIVYKVEPGRQYLFGERRIEIVGEANGFEPPRIAAIGLKEDEPASAERVLATEQALLRKAREQGFARAMLGKRTTMIDRETGRMEVVLAIEPGERMQFAMPEITGAEGIDPGFLRERITIEPGETFDPRAIEESRRQLIDTGLFSTVKVQSAVGETGSELPVTFDLRQRKHRSIGVGAGFSTGDGPNAKVFWEHRNLLGAAEKFRIEADASISLQRLRARFSKPDYLIPDLNLIIDGDIRSEDTDAFETQSIAAGIGLEREFSDTFTGTLGVAYRYASIRDDVEENTVGLFSVPGSLVWNHSDNMLDPATGWRLTLEGAPFLDTLDPGTHFIKTRLVHTRYFKLQQKPRLVLAMRGSVGSIFGADRSDIPADERFYAGGGGSVRGIPYQLAGALKDGEPIGGRSLLEGSIELRWRAFESIELVGFYDAGSVFESSVPTFDGDLEMGTGVGLRYVTPVGPIRFDVAVPVAPRDGIDKSYQFYISIGQAF